ncbi:MAG: DnaB-like helicase N-terminal domain-containing protein [Eubacterium sp.]
MKDTTEIENRLIGHIINFDEGKSLISELSDDLFTDETNRSLFAIIRKEFKSGNPDTGILLSKCSNEQKQRILECADSSFRTDNVNEYIKILIDESAKIYEIKP